MGRKPTGRPAGHQAEVRWPLAPLVAALDPSTDEELALRFGVSTRCVHRWDRDGVPDSTADVLAIRVGLVAEMVWEGWTKDRVGHLFDELRAQMAVTA